MVFSVTLAVLFSLSLYVSGFLSLLTPLPISILYLKRGVQPALLASLMGLLALFFLYDLPEVVLRFLPAMVFSPHLELNQIRWIGVLFYLFYIGIGFSLAWVSRLRIPLEKKVLRVVGSTLGPLLFLILLINQFNVGPLLQETRKALDFLMEQAITLSPQMSSEDGQLLKEPIVAGMMEMIPSISVSMTLMVLALNLLLLRRWMNKETLRAWGDFSVWGLPDQTVWAPVVAGSLYLLNLTLLKISLVSSVCLNLLVVFLSIYFFQGMAIFSYFFKRKVPPFLRLMTLFLFIFFFQPLALILTLLGLFDFWFDFRKLKKVNTKT